MKKTFTSFRRLMAGCSLLMAVPSAAQVATTYTFSQTAGTYTASAGTTIASNALGNMDDETFGPITIPNFAFDGNIYNNIYINTNGFITFGGAPAVDEYNPISDAATYMGAVSAFGHDLDAATSGTRNIRYQTIGNEFVIQWQNVARYSITGERISFQIRLNTVTNQIKIVYGGTITPGSDNTYMEVGLRGPDNTFATNVNNRKVNAGTGAWINSVAGTGNGSTCYFNSATTTTVPAAGTTFTWTPAAVDVKAVAVASPNIAGCYGKTETVSVTVTNTGGTALNFATTPLTLNVASTGPNPATFTPVVVNTGTLAVNASQNIQITTAYNMSVSGTYIFTASAAITGDSHAGNNTATDVRISHTPTVAYADAAVCSGQSIALTGTATAHPYVITATNSTAVAIPDDTPAGVNSTITISGAGTALASSATAIINNITHTFDGDLILTLTAPNGSSIILSNQEGSIDQNYTNTVFSDTATTPVSAGTGPFTGAFMPEAPFSTLTGPANGTWTLNVSDNAAADVGTLAGWSLAFQSSNGISAYSWTPSATLNNDTSASPMANPTAPTLYMVMVTDLSGCTNTDSVQVNINALPTVTASASAANVCPASNVTFTGGGAASYSWTGGITDAIPFSVSATDTYTVTGTDGNGCINTATTTVNVYTLPTVLANASVPAICDGDAVTFTGSGATSYTWTGGVTDGLPYSPAATDTYTVTGTDANGCVNTATTSVTVNPLPTVTASADLSAVCVGNNVTLTGGGAASYTWTGSVTDGLAFTPAATDTYTVTGTDANGCINTASTTVTVNTLPAVTASADLSAVCTGNNVTLTGGGATSYNWTTGVIDGVAFAPAATDTYTVTGTDGNGCINTASTTVTVNALPNVIASVDVATVCEGTIVLFAGGGDPATYTWSNGVVDLTSYTPLSTNTYTVTGTDANGCSNTDSITVTVNPLPMVDVSFAPGTQCVYNAAITLSGESPAGGTWSGNGVSGTSFDPATAGVGTSAITYTYTDANGCSAMDTTSINVDVCTGIAATGANGVELNAYPNPASGLITVSILNVNAAEKIQLQITDMLGNEVYGQQIASAGTEFTTQVDVSAFAKGTYLMKVSTGTTVKMMKIVKQ
ncbi:MAG: hypothetical protein JWP12_602 [Bacteroidetes bacterium]|nr:hypothetical protein [Bacteroidota bacterium]